MEAGSNTSTVTLGVEGGNKKGTQCLGYNWGTLFVVNYKIQVSGSPGWGSLES
jgi:hypothetical protein